MLSKLAKMNAKRSIKNYVIYLITVILSFSFMFAFNLISNSKEVLELSSTMANFKVAMYFTSAIVIFIVGFLINYTTKFMFQKRSKEFGTYELLGIKKNKITQMFILENIILGFFAFIFSIPIGILFSIIMSSIIMNIFELPHLIKMDFGLYPILLSGLYIIFIYFFVLFLSRRRIKKMSIYNLLYFEKQNEKLIHKNKKHRKFYFIISLFLGILSLILFDMQFNDISDEPSFAIILLCIFLIIFSIYGVTTTLSDFILNYVLKRRNIKYKGNNLFIARTFSSKVKSMSFTLGTITVLITLTFVVLNLSNLFKGVFEYQMDTTCPYDIAIELNPEEVDKFVTFIDEDYTINEQYVYNGYDQNDSIKKVLGLTRPTSVIKLNDFNKLLEMRGKPTITLKDNEYYLNIMKELKNDLENSPELKEITLSNGITLKQKEISSDGYIFAWGIGYGYIVVVPDSAVENLDIVETHLIINTKEKTTEEFARKLTDFYDPKLSGFSIGNIKVRGEIEASNKGFITITSFICFYLALIFIAVVGTILAIQSLSDSTKYKYRYQVLSKLGVGDNELYKIVFKQLIIYFIFPVVYPIIVSFCTIMSMNKLFQITLTNEFIYLGYFIESLLVFLVIYIIYFLTTYYGFKRNIKEI